MLIKIGTRRSRLATIQAQLAAEQIQRKFPDIVTEIVHIQTTGDILYPKPLALLGGKGLFLKEIEEQLLDKAIDIAVHSMKDVPAELPLGLIIGGMLEREDPRDAFLSVKYKTIADMPANGSIGTCASRRRALIMDQYPSLQVVDLRGNVETRLRKLEEGQIDGVIIAVSGLKRLDLASKINQIFSTESFIPAVAQGVIGLECRADDKNMLSIIQSINHQETAICVNAERSFLQAIGGDCTTPVGAYAEIIGSEVRIRAFLERMDTIWSDTRHCLLIDASQTGKSMAREALERLSI